MHSLKYSFRKPQAHVRPEIGADVVAGRSMVAFLNGSDAFSNLRFIIRSNLKLNTTYLSVITFFGKS